MTTMPPAGRPTRKAQLAAQLRNAFKTFGHHAAKHTGLGIVCAVAYFDPYVRHSRRYYELTTRWYRGNWGVDLQGGSEFGYKLLFVVLLAGLIAIFWQARRTIRDVAPTNE